MFGFWGFGQPESWLPETENPSVDIAISATEEVLLGIQAGINFDDMTNSTSSLAPRCRAMRCVGYSYYLSRRPRVCSTNCTSYDHTVFAADP